MSTEASPRFFVPSEWNALTIAGTTSNTTFAVTGLRTGDPIVEVLAQDATSGLWSGDAQALKADLTVTADGVAKFATTATTGLVVKIVWLKLA